MKALACPKPLYQSYPAACRIMGPDPHLLLKSTEACRKNQCLNCWLQELLQANSNLLSTAGWMSAPACGEGAAESCHS